MNINLAGEVTGKRYRRERHWLHSEGTKRELLA